MNRAAPIWAATASIDERPATRHCFGPRRRHDVNAERVGRSRRFARLRKRTAVSCASTSPARVAHSRTASLTGFGDFLLRLVGISRASGAVTIPAALMDFSDAKVGNFAARTRTCNPGPEAGAAEAARIYS